jgi:hypothetical protein
MYNYFRIDWLLYIFYRDGMSFMIWNELNYFRYSE